MNRSIGTQRFGFQRVARKTRAYRRALERKSLRRQELIQRVNVARTGFQCGIFKRPKPKGPGSLNLFTSPFRKKDYGPRDIGGGNLVPVQLRLHQDRHDRRVPRRFGDTTIDVHNTMVGTVTYRGQRQRFRIETDNGRMSGNPVEVIFESFRVDGGTPLSTTTAARMFGRALQELSTLMRPSMGSRSNHMGDLRDLITEARNPALPSLVNLIPVNDSVVGSLPDDDSYTLNEDDSDFSPNLEIYSTDASSPYSSEDHIYSQRYDTPNNSPDDNINEGEQDSF